MCDVKKNDSFFDLLEISIVEIEQIKTKKVINGDFKIINFLNKYSSIKVPTPTLFIDGVRVKTRDYRVVYKCNCGNINKIHLSKFLNKTTFKCVKCKEDEIKSKKHSYMLKNKLYVKIDKNNTPLNLTDIIIRSNNNFLNEDENFKIKYFIKNLTIDEFNDIKKNIISVDGFDIINNEVKFEPHLITQNQLKYSQYIIFNDKKINLKNVKFKCENCGDVYNTTRKLKTKINYHKSLCPKCVFCNKTFKIKKYKTKFNDIITYQGNLELLFINKCEMNNIKILNGESIEYEVKNKKHKYRVDFYLPEIKYLIEIKDNHIWHREQIKSGIWELKEQTVKKYSIKNNLNYKILFQEDIDEFFTSIKI